VGALLMIPAATGRQLTHTFTAFLSTSTLVSVAAVLIGITVTRLYHLTAGPMIISVASAIFVLSLFKKKI
ncbi:MAG TPA: metal ABC transporter permease, partial [Acidobacteriota bacterium]